MMESLSLETNKNCEFRCQNIRVRHSNTRNQNVRYRNCGIMLVRHMKIAKSQKQEIAFPNAQDEACGIKTPIGTVFSVQT